MGHVDPDPQGRVVTALPDGPLVEPGHAVDWWDETPAEAARYDRAHFDRDED